MKKEDVQRMLRPDWATDEIIRSHFSDAYRDPHATIVAVHDFASFARVVNAGSRRRMRKDRLERLYQLYLAISKTRLPLASKVLEQFKATVPGYGHVSLFYFVRDIEQLRSAGVVIVSTPILDALRVVEKSREAYQALMEIAQNSDTPHDDPAESSILDYRVNPTPPTVWPNV